jgi:DNA-binding FadR family transcriptional regulator
MNDELIEVQGAAIRAICGRLTAARLEDIRRSVEYACQLPGTIGWDRRAAAHAEFFALLADAAAAVGNPALAQMLNSGVSGAYQLMLAAGPSAAAVTASSRRHLLACLSAADGDGAARETESYFRIMDFMGRMFPSARR